MNRHLERRIESVTREGFEESYLGAQMHLASLEDMTSPEDPWQTALACARDGLTTAIEQATTPAEYYKARMMYVTAPLFTLPLLEGTIDTPVMRSNIKSIRNFLVQTAVNIQKDIELAEQLRRAVFAKRDEEYYRRMQNDLRGLGNEAAVIATLTTMQTYQLGYVPVPAFTWEDDGKFNLLQHRHTSTSGERTLIDAKLLPLGKDKLQKKLQIKSKATGKKLYAEDITVVSCQQLAVAVSEALRIAPPITTLPELFKTLTNHTERVRAIEMIGHEVARQAGIMPDKNDQLAS